MDYWLLMVRSMCVYPKNFQLFSIEKFRAYAELERLHTAFPDFPLTLCDCGPTERPGPPFCRASIYPLGVLLHQAGVTPHRIAF